MFHCSCFNVPSRNVVGPVGFFVAWRESWGLRFLTEAPRWLRQTQSWPFSASSLLLLLLSLSLSIRINYAVYFPEISSYLCRVIGDC